MTKIYVREMSTIHEKLPHNIKLIDELDTFIIDENGKLNLQYTL